MAANFAKVTSSYVRSGSSWLADTLTSFKLLSLRRLVVAINVHVIVTSTYSCAFKTRYIVRPNLRPFCRKMSEQLILEPYSRSLVYDKSHATSSSPHESVFRRKSLNAYRSVDGRIPPLHHVVGPFGDCRLCRIGGAQWSVKRQFCVRRTASKLG